MSNILKSAHAKGYLLDIIDLEDALNFASKAHLGQKRKYTFEPYIEHCLRVCKLLISYGINDKDMLQAALLHDTIEDTSTTQYEIETQFGKRTRELVLQLTDVSTHADDNRSIRKQMDLDHIAQSDSEGATIKLADMIDNSISIVPYDKEFAKIYIIEKGRMLEVLKHGNKDLWNLANGILIYSKIYLKL